MRHAFFVVAALVLLGGLVGMQGDSAAAEKTESLMKRKLQHSQKVLEGVAVGDFKMIERHADELIQISKLAEWRAFKTLTYELYSNDFRRASAGVLHPLQVRHVLGQRRRRADQRALQSQAQVTR